MARRIDNGVYGPLNDEIWDGLQHDGWPEEIGIDDRVFMNIWS